MYASLTVHTESTISAGREEIKTYDKLLKVIVNLLLRAAAAGKISSFYIEILQRLS